MVPLVLYVQPEVNLALGYKDFRIAIASYAGWTGDIDNWTTGQLAELNRDIQEAYRWVLKPASIPGERVTHVWSWREQTTTLTTTASDYDYTLPINFGSMVGQYMEWAAGSPYAPVRQVHDVEVTRLRSRSTQTGRPQVFGIRWRGQTAGTAQRREAIFWPTPDAAYTLTYTFALHAEALSLSNPYPLGGQDTSQLMVEACKAIGQAKKQGGRGDQWTIFMEALRAAVEEDRGQNTQPTVGVMRGTPSPIYRRTIGTTAYYYGPDSSGLYTLEA